MGYSTPVTLEAGFNPRSRVGSDVGMATTFSGHTIRGAAYVFLRQGGSWQQQAYVKASNTRETCYFSGSVAISGDTLVVGSGGETSPAKGVVNGSG